MVKETKIALKQLMYLARNGPNQFILPSLGSPVVNKPATKARKGTNPFTEEKMMFKAKHLSKDSKDKAAKIAQGDSVIHKKWFIILRTCGK